MTTAQTFEAEVKSRAEELKALAEAKKVITENTGGAESLSYGLSQESFLQLSSGMDLAHFEAVRFVRDLGRRENAPALTQLANRMATAMRFGGASQDIFAKVKGLIADMIERLEKEADADAKHKAYCDKELAYADQKKADRVAEIEKLTTAIDQMSARSAQLKEEIATLEKELATIATEQATMDKIRAEENAAYIKNKADMEQGIKGVQMALKVLSEYYASDKEHAAAEGAGQGIIGLLEVVESDFQKGLSDMTGAEESAQAEYEQLTKDNEIATAAKTQDVKYKTKESKDLDKATAEAESDRAGVQTELEAVEKYLAKLHEQCDETAPTYEELVKRRSSEIAGLKQALQILEGEAALVQQLSRHQTLRGVRRHLA
jgi:chromosome segregation ATPase